MAMMLTMSIKVTIMMKVTMTMMMKVTMTMAMTNDGNDVGDV